MNQNNNPGDPQDHGNDLKSDNQMKSQRTQPVITLFESKSVGSYVKLSAEFEGKNLVISRAIGGPDSGLPEAYGLQDFIYKRILKPDSIARLQVLWASPLQDKNAILQQLGIKFMHVEGFEMIDKFLSDNKIDFEKGEEPIQWF